jgi:8-oxo-dGTP pyrophosphatase MutT (NUDIX family)
MSSIDSIQLPLLIDPKKKRYIRSQFGALCYRFKNDQIEFLLITSRRTKRWILPKGWPENHMTPGESAANEAFEEAGVTGKSDERPIGIYCYEKKMEFSKNYSCIVTVFSLKVKKILSDYPEKLERKRKWFSRNSAAKCVAEPGLAQLIKSFDAS